MKTTGEAAIVYAEKKCESYYCDEIYDLLKEMCQIGFEGGVAFAQGWIPVSEELPGAQKDMDNLSAVVVAKCTGLADEVSAYLDLNKNVWRRYPSGSIVTVTEWRPIELE